MGIYTKKGDEGFTSTLSGERISKNDARIHFEGTLDELNSHLGLVKAKIQDEGDRKFLETIQSKLMKLMAHGSDESNKKYFFTEDETAELEREIDKIQEFLPKQFKLVLPGKNETEAQIHIARTVARRAERRLVALNAETPLDPHAASYLNRLSDYLFVLSRKN